MEFYTIHKPQIEESVDEGVGNCVGAGEDEEAVLQSRVQLLEGFLVYQEPEIIVEDPL